MGQADSHAARRGPLRCQVRFSGAGKEDIELARKRAELSLYLEKATELQKEFSALRGSLIEFSTRFTRVIGSRGADREAPTATNVREFAAGRLQ